MSKQVTVVMVPRERYGAIPRALQTLYDHTEPGTFRLVVVDGGLPTHVRDLLESEQKHRGFEFIHEEFPPTPTEARNIGLRSVDTPYVVFSDNDVIFTPNWLPPLLRTAEEYNAWLVGPTILDGEPGEGKIHAAAGDSVVEEVDGKRHYHFVPGRSQQQLDEVRDQLQRGPVTMLEFHVMMARTSALDTIGPLDERVSSFADHDDLVRTVLEANGAVVYEPDSVVAYRDPGTNISVLEPGDLPIYLLRWSDEWNLPSIQRVAEKWQLDPEDPWIPHATAWFQVRRRSAYHIGGLFGRLVGFTLYKVSQDIGERMERAFCRKYTGQLLKLREEFLQPVATVQRQRQRMHAD